MDKIIEYIKNNDLQSIKSLRLNKLNMIDEYGNNAFIYACMYSYDICLILIKKKINVNVVNNDGDCALHFLLEPLKKDNDKYDLKEIVDSITYYIFLENKKGIKPIDKVIIKNNDVYYIDIICTLIINNIKVKYGNDYENEYTIKKNTHMIYKKSINILLQNIFAEFQNVKNFSNTMCNFIECLFDYNLIDTDINYFKYLFYEHKNQKYICVTEIFLKHMPNVDITTITNNEGDNIIKRMCDSGICLTCLIKIIDIIIKKGEIKFFNNNKFRPLIYFTKKYNIYKYEKHNTYKNIIINLLRISNIDDIDSNGKCALYYLLKNDMYKCITASDIFPIHINKSILFETTISMMTNDEILQIISGDNNTFVQNYIINNNTVNIISNINKNNLFHMLFYNNNPACINENFIIYLNYKINPKYMYTLNSKDIEPFELIYNKINKSTCNLINIYIKNGFNINHIDNKGNNLLTGFISLKFKLNSKSFINKNYLINIIKLLCRRGINIEHKNIDGMTALDLSYKYYSNDYVVSYTLLKYIN